jgi:hypothetical protein
MQVPILNPEIFLVPRVLWAPLPIPLIKVVAKIAQKDGMQNPLVPTTIVKNAIVENTVMQQKSLMLGFVVKIVPLVVFLHTKALTDHWYQHHAKDAPLASGTTKRDNKKNQLVKRAAPGIMEVPTVVLPR